MKLIVLNLPRDYDLETFENLFKQFGNIAACNLVMDDETGVSKGFGFVEMAEESAALAAIEKLHGKKYGKFKLRVKPANTDTGTDTGTDTPEA